MSDEARHLLDEALRLPLAERATVVAALLASMDGDADADAATAWAIELQQRAEAALAGATQGVPWETVRADIEAKRRGR